MAQKWVSDAFLVNIGQLDHYVVFGTTGFKLMVTLQSGCVHEILTLCRMNKILFQKYHEKAEIHSFPTMYNTI